MSEVTRSEMLNRWQLSLPVTPNQVDDQSLALSSLKAEQSTAFCYLKIGSSEEDEQPIKVSLELQMPRTKIIKHVYSKKIDTFFQEMEPTHLIRKEKNLQTNPSDEPI